MRLDSHQHFWDFGANSADYVWMSTAEADLRRDFMPEMLAPLLEEMGFNGCIAVQAREMTDENTFLLGLAERFSWIKGVVGWIDLTADHVEAAIEAAIHPNLKGLRMVIHDHVDPDFADCTAHRRGIAALARHTLTYDLLIRPREMAAALRLVDAFPHQPFVVDHLAKPKLDGSDWATWSAGLSQLAERPNVWAKLSGLVTLGPWDAWREQDYARFLDFATTQFGVGRCMIGSDWPVSTLAASHTETLGVVKGWAQALSEDEQAAILGGSCAAFYGVK